MYESNAWNVLVASSCMQNVERYIVHLVMKKQGKSSTDFINVTMHGQLHIIAKKYRRRRLKSNQRSLDSFLHHGNTNLIIVTGQHDMRNAKSTPTNAMQTKLFCLRLIKHTLIPTKQKAYFQQNSLSQLQLR